MSSIEHKIGWFINGMREYQRIHNITQRCVVNSLLVRDTLFRIGSFIKLLPCFALYVKDDVAIIVVHMIILLDDNETYIDVSYDVFKHKNVSYYITIKEIKDVLSKTNIVLDREWIVKFMDFVKMADRLNNNISIELTELNDQMYYYEQREFAVNFAEQQDASSYILTV